MRCCIPDVMLSAPYLRVNVDKPLAMNKDRWLTVGVLGFGTAD